MKLSPRTPTTPTTAATAATAASFESGKSKWLSPHKACGVTAHRCILFLLVVAAIASLFSWQTKTTNTTFGHHTIIHQDEKAMWTWQSFQQHKWSTKKQTPTLLIGHYASQQEGDLYRVMMQESMKASRAYCRRWHCDVASVEGILFKHPTHNKVGLLEAAMERGYDRLLLLDADCVLFNHTVNVAQLIPTDKMVMAQHVWGDLQREPWNTNVGVTLWNLRYDLLPRFLSRWKERCATDHMNNDQWHFHIIIQGKEGESSDFVQSQLAVTEHYFKGENATIVKHFKRDSDASWGQPAQGRIDKVREQVEQVCRDNAYC